MKNGIKVFAFLLLGGLMFWVIQDVLTPDHNKTVNSHYILSGFQKLEPDSVDVLLVGPSHIVDDVYSMELYRDHQIRAYSLATGGQPFNVSYYMIKYAFETQSPRIVILDAAHIPHPNSRSNSEGYWKFVIDNMPMGLTKIELGAAYGAEYSSEAEGVLSAVFPIIDYHSRWNELSEEDFVPRSTGYYYSMGSFVMSQISGTNWTLKEINRWATEASSINQSEMIYIKDGAEGKTEITTPNLEQKLSEEAIEILKKIKDMCDQNGAELVLVNIPSRVYLLPGNRAWTTDVSRQVGNLAEQLGLTFIDLMYDVDTGVDFSTDTIDGGVHLNVRGAEKVSHFLSGWLDENFVFDHAANDIWDAQLEKFDKVLEVALLQSETDFSEYLSRLIRNADKWDILISAREEFTNALNEDDFEKFRSLGLTLISRAKWVDSYLSVVKSGQAEYEAMSQRRINYKTELEYNGKTVSMISSGANSISYASIKIGEQEYAPNKNGLNIVVIDRETGLVIDSCSFNTRHEEAAASRTISIYYYLRDYESAVCFE